MHMPRLSVRKTSNRSGIGEKSDISGEQNIPIQKAPQSFVVGFLFDDKGNMALIRKTKPKWQKGLLNGVGGKIELGEEPLKAMRREFLEETGAGVLDWRLFYILRLEDGGSVYFYVSHGERKLEDTTEEHVDWYKVASLKRLNTVPNLQWLIPIAEKKHMDDIGVIIKRIDENDFK